MPSYNQAKVLLTPAITCDKDDSWRATCKVASSAPLIGSFAYGVAVGLGGTPQVQAGMPGESYGATRPLFESIFYASQIPAKFSGLYPPSGMYVNGPDPNGILCARTDGSVYLRHPLQTTAPTILLFSWPLVFTPSDATFVKIK